MAAAAGEAVGMVREISAVGAAELAAADEPLRSDCLRLARKVSLLAHLAAEIADAGEAAGSSSSSEAAAAACLQELLRALAAARRFVMLGRSPPPAADPDTMCNNIAVQFKCVTWQLQAALANLPYNYFGISDEVQEEVDLVRAQLRREMEKKGTLDVNIFSEIQDILSRSGDNVELHSQQSPSELETSQMEKLADDHQDLQNIVILVAEINGMPNSNVKRITSELIERLEKVKFNDSSETVNAENQSTDASKSTPEKVRKLDSPAIPEDFRCPISLELMRDPVIVSTGQTYERAFIQRWIDCGNRTCPKTQQKLQNLTLTPNYVLRSLIMQWCEEKGIEPPSRSKSDGSSLEIGGDRVAIEALVCNLSSSSLDERKSAAAEIRSLAKRSTDNRILLAEAGAIPALVNLLSSKDSKTQEHAVTSLLNLSIYDHNKELIVLAGAILPIIQVLKVGSMEARENAAAGIFSLSLIDENKIKIGSAPGAIEALVELLQSGSSRGRKDAATALFNLCIYQANKIRAVRAGILPPLIQMLQDSSSHATIDEALTILAVLVNHQECKAAITKANAIPFLIDVLRSGQARNKENAAAILLALCKKDAENLACIGRLGALIPLTELIKTGTDRAKRKATSLLEHLSKMQVL